MSEVKNKSKKSTQLQNITTNSSLEKDDRFKKISYDPKFKEIPKKVRKIEVKDPRFASMFTNKKFNEGLEFDLYGRQTETTNKASDLKRYYTIDNEDDQEKLESQSVSDQVDFMEGVERNENDSDTSEEFQEFLQTEYQKGNEEDPFSVLEQKEIPTGEETSRLSLMKIDWDNISSVDLYVLFSSFCKGSSKILKVEIYPSEFGIKEIEKQKLEGPSKEIFIQEENSSNKNKKKKKMIHNLDEIDEDEEDNTEGFNPKELRKYELKKLLYYYAVIHCNNKETAMHIYNECDGMEIEKTQNIMDLRFIPDSLKEFPYPPKEICDNFPLDYNPKFFLNSALQHSKVKLTWETNDPKRSELIAKAFSKEQFNQEDIQQLLMSSDSETDEDAKQFAENFLKGKKLEEDSDDKGLTLLKKKKEKEVKYKDGETIEITFNKGFEGINDKIGDKNSSKKDKSMWQNYLERKKNKRREKKMEERKIKEGKKTKRADNFDNKNEVATASKKELNLLVDQSLKNKSIKFNKDKRFDAIEKDNRFAIDPTSKEYKKMKK